MHRSQGDPGHKAVLTSPSCLPLPWHRLPPQPRHFAVSSCPDAHPWPPRTRLAMPPTHCGSSRLAWAATCLLPWPLGGRACVLPLVCLGRRWGPRGETYAWCDQLWREENSAREQHQQGAPNPASPWSCVQSWTSPSRCSWLSGSPPADPPTPETSDAPDNSFFMLPSRVSDQPKVTQRPPAPPACRAPLRLTSGGKGDAGLFGCPPGTPLVPQAARFH